MNFKGKAGSHNVYRATFFSAPKKEYAAPIGRSGELIELQAMVDIAALNMSNVIVITGRPGIGKHTVAQYLEHYSGMHNMTVLRSGRADNLYLEGEVQTKTILTAWRNVFILAICMLHAERTNSSNTNSGDHTSLDFVSRLPFDLRDEVQLFIGEDGLGGANLELMYPELAASESNGGIDEGKGNAGNANNANLLKAPMPNSALEPKAHLKIHNEEKKLVALLTVFFRKFCATHPCILAFENKHGMCSTGTEPSSWRLFYDLLVGGASEPAASRPKFCIITTDTISKKCKEYHKAMAVAKQHQTLLHIKPMLPDDVEILLKEKLAISHVALSADVRNWVCDISEGNPLIISELARSILDSSVCHIEKGVYKLRSDRTIHSIQLNKKLRHMVLQEFSVLPPHDQLVAKMASVYTSDFSLSMLIGHVQQHKLDHEGTPINLEK